MPASRRGRRAWPCGESMNEEEYDLEEALFLEEFSKIKTLAEGARWMRSRGKNAWRPKKPVSDLVCEEEEGGEIENGKEAYEGH